MSRGSSLVELLVATMLGLAVLSVLTLVVGVGGRLLAACGARGEAEDTAALAVEAFTFDARRAGFDPRAGGVEALAEARPTRLTFLADLDASGAIDAASEETTAYVCASGQLSRVIGRQSLPLADRTTACAFRYLDRSGAEIAVAAGGLDAGGRQAVRAVAIDLGLRAGLLHAATARSVVIALRERS